MGASGSGKTSLLRAIAGLWRSGSGTIKRYVKHRVEVGSEDMGAADASTTQNGTSESPGQKLVEEVINLSN